MPDNVDSKSAADISVDDRSLDQMFTSQMFVDQMSVLMMSGYEISLCVTFYQTTLHRNTFFPIRFSAATWTRQRSDGTTSISRSLPGSSGFIRWPGTRGSVSVPVSAPYNFSPTPFMLRLNKLECLFQKSFLCVNGCLFLYC
jgi:hypothetical protein